jgi:hypothetical protein
VAFDVTDDAIGKRIFFPHRRAPLPTRITGRR